MDSALVERASEVLTETKAFLDPTDAADPGVRLQLPGVRRSW